MENFAIYCKTYSGDLDRVEYLIKSFHKFNKDNIKFYLSAPEIELHLFEKFKSENLFIISDESFAEEFLTKEPVAGIRPGYINQEICKLNFYRTNVCENYLCVDSDSLFIRDFYKSDFMHDEKTPYTVLVMDKDLSIEKFYHNKFWVSRQEEIQKIYNEIGLQDRRLRTCHGHQVLNCKVLASLYNDFMMPRKWDYTDMLEFSSFEFTWYNVWFQKTKLVKEYAIEPFFLTFHIHENYFFTRLKNLDIEDLKYAYVGIVMNNKWEIGTPYEYEPISEAEKIFYEGFTKNPKIIEIFSDFIKNGSKSQKRWKKLMINLISGLILNKQKRRTFRKKLTYLFS